MTEMLNKYFKIKKFGPWKGTHTPLHMPWPRVASSWKKCYSVGEKMGRITSQEDLD